MSEIADFTTKYKAAKRTENFLKIISRYTEMLKGYYFAIDGFIPPDDKLNIEAIEIFSQKKKNGYFNELNEPIRQDSLTLERKNNILYFPPKKEVKCQKT